MEKKMEELVVEVKSGKISLWQSSNDPPLEGFKEVIISSDQVDILIKWLKEAKEEIEADN